MWCCVVNINVCDTSVKKCTESQDVLGKLRTGTKTGCNKSMQCVLHRVKIGGAGDRCNGAHRETCGGENEAGCDGKGGERCQGRETENIEEVTINMERGYAWPVDEKTDHRSRKMCEQDT